MAFSSAALAKPKNPGGGNGNAGGGNARGGNANGANGQAGQVNPADYRVTFVSHAYDAARCETQVCWDVTSPSRYGISHFTLGIAGCDPVAATVQRQPSGVVTSYKNGQLDGLYTANDPNCGVGGIKFDDGFNDGETRRVCLTYAGMQPLATGTTAFTVKAATSCVPTMAVDGPACGAPASCSAGECGDGVWTCPTAGGPAVCEAGDTTCGGCTQTCGDGTWCGGAECDPSSGSCTTIDRCPDSSRPYCQEGSRSCSECPDGSVKNACGGCGPLDGTPGEACGEDACAPGTYECVGTDVVCKTSPIVCEGGNECTAVICHEGACVPVTDDEDCAELDGNLCTAPVCDALLGCVERNAVTCADNGLTCDGREECIPETGACGSVEPPCVGEGWYCNEDDDQCYDCPDFSDHNACGGCGPLDGAPGDACGDACEVGELVCQGDQLVCGDRSAVDCDDQNACTEDSCDREVGCRNEPKTCADGDLCTVDSCDPKTGCVFPRKSCDDGVFCNGVETCQPRTGECVRVGPQPCTEGVCIEETQQCVACARAEDCAPAGDACVAVSCVQNTCHYDSSACGGGECVDTIDLGLLTEYNLLACGDYFGLDVLGGPSSDVEGWIAVAGQVYLRGFRVATRRPGPLAMVVGGSWDLAHGEVDGGAYYAVARQDQNVTFLGGAFQGTPIDFAAECTKGEAASEALANLATNGVTQVEYWSGRADITLRGSNPGANVFEVLGDDLNNSQGVFIVVPEGASVVINVVGAPEVTMFNFMTFFRESHSNAPVTLTARDILWNFPDAEVLNLSQITVQGSVLAPWADVFFTNGNIDGSMIAHNVTGRG